MTDTRLDRILAYGTDAERLALTPDPPAGVLVFFYTEDTGKIWLWDTDAGPADWVEFAAQPSTFILSGDRGDQPDATAVAEGTLYFVEDEGVVERSDGADWNPYSGSGGPTVVPLTIVNPGAETGDMTGWTGAGGGFTSQEANPSGHAMTPFEGSRAFVCSSNASPSMHQDIDVSAHDTEIDAGTVELDMSAWGCHTFTDNDRVDLVVDCLDGSDARIGMIIARMTDNIISTSNWWSLLRARGYLPVGTRTLRLTAQGVRVTGTANNAAIDAFAGNLLKH